MTNVSVMTFLRSTVPGLPAWWAWRPDLEDDALASERYGQNGQKGICGGLFSWRFEVRAIGGLQEVSGHI